MMDRETRIPRALSIPILAFHKVDPRWEWGVTRVTPRRFARVIEYLRTSGYQTLTFSQALDPCIPFPPKPVILTFDDAYQSVFDHAFPLLMEVGFTATVFVITHYVGRENTWDVNLGGLRFLHMGWEALRTMAEAGFEIGSHTHTHVDLTRVPPQRVKEELLVSKRILEDSLGFAVEIVSFPFGRYLPETLRLSRMAGYRAACAFWKRCPDDQEFVVFERNAYYLFDGQLSLEAKLGRKGWSALEGWKLKVINAFSYGTTWVKPS